MRKGYYKNNILALDIHFDTQAGALMRWKKYGRFFDGLFFGNSRDC